MHPHLPAQPELCDRCACPALCIPPCPCLCHDPGRFISSIPHIRPLMLTNGCISVCRPTSSSSPCPQARGLALMSTRLAPLAWASAPPLVSVLSTPSGTSRIQVQHLRRIDLISYTQGVRHPAFRCIHCGHTMGSLQGGLRLRRHRALRPRPPGYLCCPRCH